MQAAYTRSSLTFRHISAETPACSLPPKVASPRALFPPHKSPDFVDLRRESGGRLSGDTPGCSPAPRLGPVEGGGRRSVRAPPTRPLPPGRGAWELLSLRRAAPAPTRHRLPLPLPSPPLPPGRGLTGLRPLEQ